MTTSVSVYHGTSFSFDAFSQAKARTKNDYYGGGIAYFTDNREIARQYANASTVLSKIQKKLIYSIQLNFNKLFDVDATFSGKELLKFVGSNVEQFARAAGLLKLGVDKYQVIADLKDGRMELSGDDIFRGLSYGMKDVNKTANKLKSMGYDCLRYNGGLSKYGSVKHNVYVPYKVENIIIRGVEEV